MGKSSTKAKIKYNKKAYRVFNSRFKPEQREIFDKHCEKNGYSKNEFVITSVLEKIERETGKTFEELLKETQQSKSSD